MGIRGETARLSVRWVALATAVAALAGCTASPPLPSVTVVSEREVDEAHDPIEQYADDRLSTMSLDQKIQSMFMVHLAGVDAAQLASYAANNQVGGLILMGDNVPDAPDALAAMTPVIAGEAGLPILIGIDQEGGIVARIWTDASPSAAELRYQDPAATRDAFAARGAMLDSLGVSVNFGIVADIAADPASFIFERSFGSTAAEASPRVAEAVEGESGHVLSTLKHFPGHGVAPGDSHSIVPTTAMGLDEWRASHEQPFAAGIDAGAEFVMFGHLQFDAVDPVPASLSPVWHEVLRSELGFEGITITDDLGMLHNTGLPEYADTAATAVRAVAAGNTMLLYVGPVDVPGVTAVIRSAVESGAIDAALIDDAARRLLVTRRTISGQTDSFVHCFQECAALLG